jgi:leucyl-tRNA synthetase
VDYNFEEIERKWQKHWKDTGTFAAVDFDETKPKYYANWEFPYPSAEGLHVGHPRGTIAIDVIARMKRQQGYNVLHSIGWDAFGLPSERYALKVGEKPQNTTIRCADNYKRQISAMGISYDWDREIFTTDPSYYKWTQWLFLQFYKHGLAYKQKAEINFCPDCKIGLANEEVVDNRCERCGAEVEKQEKNQWMLKITAYAERLLEGLEDFEAPEYVKLSQKNWIGKSKGVEFSFESELPVDFKVFTTRPDTIYGTTFIVIAPEAKAINKLKPYINNWDEVSEYVEQSKQKSELERKQNAKEKTGVELKGVKVINPFTKKPVKVFVGDFVIASYGTGIVMATPAHDERDYAFAKKYDIEIVQVVKGNNNEPLPYCEKEGTLVNSGEYTGLTVEKAIEKIVDYMQAQGFGEAKTNYALRDWVFSRQRYWGEPIPLVNCNECGWVPVADKDLPVTLPETKDYMPTEKGESPLAKVTDWVNTTCPKCGKSAKRETDVMPNWAGSSWYFLRYIDPHNSEEFANYDKLKYWLPLDIYDGGQEHITLHVLYSRFWNNFFYDIGLSPVREYFKRKTVHGYILGENGEKMSKSKGNVINPDECIKEFGADAFRVYEMFIGAFNQTSFWSDKGLKGVKKFLDKVWLMQELINENLSEEVEVSLNDTIKKVTQDTEATKFNTAVAAMMTFVNTVYEHKTVTKEQFLKLIVLLSPYAPHLAEEINEKYKVVDGSMQYAPWPKVSEFTRKTVEIMVQKNSKNLVKANVPADASKEEVLEIIKTNEKVAPLMQNIVKVIYIKNRLVNLIVKG